MKDNEDEKCIKIKNLETMNYIDFTKQKKRVSSKRRKVPKKGKRLYFEHIARIIHGITALTAETRIVTVF